MGAVGTTLLVFHVSQLKKCKGSVTGMSTLPQLDDTGLIMKEPVVVLKRRLGRQGNTPLTYLLVQWSDHGVEDATWEPYQDAVNRFPNFSFDS